MKLHAFAADNAEGRLTLRETIVFCIHVSILFAERHNPGFYEKQLSVNAPAKCNGHEPKARKNYFKALFALIAEFPFTWYAQFTPEELLKLRPPIPFRHAARITLYIYGILEQITRCHR